VGVLDYILTATICKQIISVVSPCIVLSMHDQIVYARMKV